MEPKRYWWASISKYSNKKKLTLVWEGVSDMHPFMHVDKMERIANDGHVYTLNSWKLISCEEYELWNQLYNAEQR